MLRFGLCVIAALGASLSGSPQRGREIYRNGGNADAPTIRAVIAGSSQPLEASMLPCASCHGSDGRGGNSESGAKPPDITPLTLQQPADVGTRRRAAYTPALLTRAITLGFDASGNPLDRVMPRFQLSTRDARDLIAYLAVIDRETPPGVSDDALRIVLLGAPTIEAPATTLYGRRIELVRTPSPDALITIDADAHGDAQLEAAERERMPTVVLGAKHPPPGRHGFVLTSTESERIAALRAFAASAGHASVVATDCATLRAADAQTWLLFSATTLDDCGRSEPELADRHVIIAFAYPPDAAGSEQLVRAALERVLAALADAGRDVTRETLLDALERPAPASTSMSTFGLLGWSRQRHVGFDRAWLATFDARSGTLRAEPGWSDVVR